MLVSIILIRNNCNSGRIQSTPNITMINIRYSLLINCQNIYCNNICRRARARLFLKKNYALQQFRRNVYLTLVRVYLSIKMYTK